MIVSATLLILAGCDRAPEPKLVNRDDAADNFTPANITRPPVNEAAPPSAPPPAAEPAADSPKAAPGGLPEKLLGDWVALDGNCRDRAALTRVVIQPRQLIFFESVGMVQSVRALPDGVVGADVAYSGEGESWHRDQTFLLSHGGDRLTIKGVGADVVRKRCP